MLSPFASSVRPLYQGFLGRDQSNYLVFEPISPLALRLPTELTCEIFLYCLPDDEFNVPKSTTAPLLVCHIFKRWRNIALATPGLWSSLNLNLKWFRKSYWDTEMDGVRFFSSWIRNARNAPLSIRLCPLPPDGAHDTESPRRTPDPVCQSDVRAVLAMIRERAAQWQNISLWLSWEYEYVRDTLPAEGSVPRLQKFAIEGVHVLYFSRFSNLLARLGALRELHLDDLQAPSLLMAPQWTQLTAFDVRSIQFSHCIDVLHFAPNLLHCTFYIIHNAPQHRDVRSVTSNLQALTLSENRPHDKPLPIALLQRLTLPSLKRLQLHFLEDRLMYPARRIIPGFAPIAPSSPSSYMNCLSTICPSRRRRSWNVLPLSPLS
ncbi:hypothetical protein B0H13DRAFT_2662457 [Mycena leptocephala]|nr:hypothetical protein B0H13DRAFT_2662457 [Mycena leptocephala]